MRSPLAGPIGGPESNAHTVGPFQVLPPTMRRYRNHEPVDVCIVGVGSAGGVLLQRPARAGLSVVGIEAGPFWDTERDWVSDEAGSQKLYWNDLRITGGDDPIALGIRWEASESAANHEGFHVRRRRWFATLACPSFGATL
jgi:choline dehydrogenase-like flavoprotein